MSERKKELFCGSALVRRFTYKTAMSREKYALLVVHCQETANLAAPRGISALFSHAVDRCLRLSPTVSGSGVCC